MLVVDDNMDMTSSIQMMIEKRNHRLATANDEENGYSAYSQLKKEVMPVKDKEIQ